MGSDVVIGGKVSVTVQAPDGEVATVDGVGVLSFVFTEEGSTIMATGAFNKVEAVSVVLGQLRKVFGEESVLSAILEFTQKQLGDMQTMLADVQAALADADSEG